MRKILFRGKRKDNGEWIMSSDICQANYDEVYLSDYGIWAEVYSETVGQSTGLTDKNDKEIFEGDIFKSSTGYISVVEWCDDGRFLGFGINREVSAYMHGDRVITYIAQEPTVEVIGNIHDTPELLEASDD